MMISEDAAADGSLLNTGVVSTPPSVIKNGWPGGGGYKYPQHQASSNPRLLYKKRKHTTYKPPHKAKESRAENKPSITVKDP